MKLRTIDWKNGIVITIDQTKLPEKLVYNKLKKPGQIAEAIRNMRIRGAPLLGAAAALSLAQTAFSSKTESKIRLLNELEKTCKLIRNTRPTAVNLFNSLDSIMKESRELKGSFSDLRKYVVRCSLKILEKDEQMNYALNINGAKLIQDGETILTHCNAGELATVRHGTAVGLIKMAYKQGKKIKVIATETRPLLQGARLTAFELKRSHVPFTLVTDSMVGYLMWKNMVDKVIVGADRILTSGHVLNKIGTYTIALVSKAHNIPFYVAAPTSTIDFDKSIEEVVVEERPQEEVLEFKGIRTAPKGTKAFNPAFDITPPELITGIITEEGVIAPKMSDIVRLRG